MSNEEAQGQAGAITEEHEEPASNTNPLAWIQRYLDLADRLMGKGRDADDRDRHRIA